MKTISYLLVISILFSSCASILNGKYQKVDIVTDSNNKVSLNGEDPEMKKGQYLFRRDRKPTQITVEQEGYKTIHKTVMPYKKSPLYIMSVIPFGILLYPMLYDQGPKAYNYDKSFIVGKDMLPIPEKDEDSKNITLNKVSVDLGANNIKYRYFRSYKKYLRKEEKTEAESTEDSEEKVEVENSAFSLALKEVLRKKGYVDTSNRALKNSYTNNIIVNATIKDYTLHQVSSFVVAAYGGMMYVDLTIDWEVLDLYEKPIIDYTTNVTSGEFAYFNHEEKSVAINNAIEDAMEFGLIDFLSNNKVKKQINDQSIAEKEKAYSAISIPKPKSYVSSVSEAIESSVTIKTKDGHGSGFIISENGHIITNFHVVSDSSDLKVVLNNGDKYDLEVIRVSRVHDLALLKIDAKNLKPFKLNSSKDIKIAQEIYAVGTPKAEDLSQTISRGIISGIRDRGEEGAKLIQTDASINSGNSGGAIITKDGVVRGVVSGKLFGFGVEGVAFGIPSYEIFDRLKVSYQ